MKSDVRALTCTNTRAVGKLMMTDAGVASTMDLGSRDHHRPSPPISPRLVSSVSGACSIDQCFQNGRCTQQTTAPFITSRTLIVTCFAVCIDALVNSPLSAK